MTEYLGQCDDVRRSSKESDRRWHKMMERARPVSADMFLRAVDISPMLDAGEDPRRAIADMKRSDPSTGLYVSRWGGRRCWFVQHAGFEFIFLD